MANTSNGKQPASQLRGRDWHYRVDNDYGLPYSTAEQMGNLILPFMLKPETLNSITSEFSENATFIKSMTLPGSVS